MKICSLPEVRLLFLRELKFPTDVLVVWQPENTFDAWRDEIASVEPIEAWDAIFADVPGLSVWFSEKVP